MVLTIQSACSTVTSRLPVSAALAGMKGSARCQKERQPTVRYLSQSIDVRPGPRLPAALALFMPRLVVRLV